MSEPIVERIEAYALNQKDRPKVEFSEVGIVGCGSTGQRIVLAVAKRGIDVIFLELTEEKIAHALHEIEEALDLEINRWGMTVSEKKLVLSRIKGTLNYTNFKNCDIVIESTLTPRHENGAVMRKAIFKKIEEHVSAECIIATNASTAIITELAAELRHRERCLGLHFSTTFANASLVEVVKALYTSPDICKNVRRFTTLINKEPIAVEESPGLVSVRLGMALIGEACDLLMEGVSPKEEIDEITKKGLGLPYGPFEMADKIGLDRVVRWMDDLYNEFGDMKYKPAPILRKLVRGKHLGVKTCEGFYKYDELGRKIGDQTSQPGCPKR